LSAGLATPRAAFLLTSPLVIGKLFASRAGHALANERVRLIRKFGQEKKVIAAKAVGVVKLLLLVHVRASERNVEECALITAILPHRCFDAAKPQRFHRRGTGSRRIPRCG